MTLKESLHNTLNTLPKDVTLIAVSKTRTVEEIQEMYDAGQRDFGENKVQELVQKAEVLPKDIRWHLIGHLQKNKVKYIAPFVYLLHSVDNEELLQTIQKEAKKNDRIIPILIQIKIAQEETKFGLDFNEALVLLQEIKNGKFPNVEVKGLMGMASFVEDTQQIKEEFTSLSDFYNKYKQEFNFSVLSMGMSDDYPIAIECGSTMVRIGTKLFGKRNYAI